MEQSVRIGSDSGEPIVASRLNSAAKNALKSITEQVAARVSVITMKKNNASKNIA
jgi:hypothetical protein